MDNDGTVDSVNILKSHLDKFWLDQGLSKGDEHPTNTPHGVRYSLPFYLNGRHLIVACHWHSMFGRWALSAAGHWPGTCYLTVVVIWVSPRKHVLQFLHIGEQCTLAAAGEYD